MRKIAEELIIQTKTFLRAVLFGFIFILPWIYHFCGPRKIAATRLESGYHLATSNALLISGEKHRVTAVALQKDAQGVICLYSGLELLLSQSFSHSKATSPWFTLAQTSASAVLPNGLANAVCPRLWSLFYSDLILFRLSGLFYYYINPLLLLLLLLLLFQKSWPMVFVLWN